MGNSMHEKLIKPLSLLYLPTNRGTFCLFFMSSILAVAVTVRHFGHWQKLLQQKSRERFVTGGCSQLFRQA